MVFLEITKIPVWLEQLRQRIISVLLTRRVELLEKCNQFPSAYRSHLYL